MSAVEGVQISPDEPWGRAPEIGFEKGRLIPAQPPSESGYLLVLAGV
jgi:hypothetical protein